MKVTEWGIKASYPVFIYRQPLNFCIIMHVAITVLTTCIKKHQMGILNFNSQTYDTKTVSGLEDNK